MSSNPEKKNYDSVKVVSYNVLTPTYGMKHIVPNPEDLEPKTRCARIVKKLEPHISSNAIICMQEVGQSWAGAFTSEFQRRNYSVLYAPYGEDHSDYFGVMIAVPNQEFDLVDAKIVRVADTKKWPKFDRNLELKWRWETLIYSKLQNFGKFNFTMLILSLLPVWIFLLPFALVWLLWVLFFKKCDLPPWMKAKARKNVLIMAKVQCKKNGASGSSFVVATYHMPCAFYSPPLMVIHSALSMQAIQEFSKGSPFIFCGDFNFKPEDECYELLTRGQLPEKFQNLIPNDLWSPNLVKPTQSAYFSYLGHEPKFTNHASVRPGDVFTGTLDYIFVSKDCTISQVVALPSEPYASTIPCNELNEPSDHLLIGAEIQVPQYSL